MSGAILKSEVRCTDKTSPSLPLKRLFLKIGACDISRADLELRILTPGLPKCRASRHVPSCLEVSPCSWRDRVLQDTSSLHWQEQNPALAPILQPHSHHLPLWSRNPAAVLSGGLPVSCLRLLYLPPVLQDSGSKPRLGTKNWELWFHLFCPQIHWGDFVGSKGPEKHVECGTGVPSVFVRLVFKYPS